MSSQTKKSQILNSVDVFEKTPPAPCCSELKVKIGFLAEYDEKYSGNYTADGKYSYGGWFHKKNNIKNLNLFFLYFSRSVPRVQEGRRPQEIPCPHFGTHPVGFPIKLFR